MRERRSDIAPLAEYFGRGTVRALGAARFPGLSAEAVETLHAHPFPGNVRELKGLIERSVVRAFLRDESLTEPIADLVLDPFDSPYRLGAPAGPAGSGNPAVTPPAPSPQETAAPDAGFADRVMAFERRLIDEALRATADHQGKAARRLGLTYHQFRGLLRKHGLKK